MAIRRRRDSALDTRAKGSGPRVTVTYYRRQIEIGVSLLLQLHVKQGGHTAVHPIALMNMRANLFLSLNTLHCIEASPPNTSCLHLATLSPPSRFAHYLVKRLRRRYSF